MSLGGGLFSAPGCPGSIVGAAMFHFRVRDGNGWVRRALTTEASSMPTTIAADKRQAGGERHGISNRMPRGACGRVKRSVKKRSVKKRTYEHASKRAEAEPPPFPIDW